MAEQNTSFLEKNASSKGWQIVELDKVCYKPEYGFTDSASQNGNAQFLRITDITENGVNWNAVPFCNCNNLEKYRLKDNDVVFARIGATTGKSYLIKNVPENAVYASYLIRVRAKDIDPEYLYYYFQTNDYWKQIDSQKGTNLKGWVNGSILSKLKIPVCSRQIQRGIAETLSSIQSSISEQKNLIEKLRELKQSMVNELFTRGVRGEKTKTTEIGEIPESWEIVYLWEISDKVGKNYQPLQNGWFRYVGLEHIESGNTEIRKWWNEGDAVSTKTLFSSGEILYWKLRPYLDKAAIPDFNGICSTDIIVISANKKSQNDFLVQLMHTAGFINFAKKSTSGVNHPRTSWNELKKFQFALPSLPEQMEITSLLGAIDQKIKIHTEKFISYESLFKTLLQELMSGERRII